MVLFLPSFIDLAGYCSGVENIILQTRNTQVYENRHFMRSANDLKLVETLKITNNNIKTNMYSFLTVLLTMTVFSRGDVNQTWIHKNS